VALEIASLLIASVRPVPWTEHNDEAVENFRLALQIGRLSGHSGYIEPIGTMVPRAKKERSDMLAKKIILVVLFSLIPGTLMAQEVKVASLMSKVMTDVSGKEGLMITVEYPPGGSDPIHRHNAHAFLYVLEGSVVMQVKGGKQVTLTPGQTFYEDSNDVHIVGRNASKTRPAKFLVFLVKDKDAPVLVPVK
jgi:quercetin dioxygenase-like cupin family protein